MASIRCLFLLAAHRSVNTRGIDSPIMADLWGWGQRDISNWTLLWYPVTLSSGFSLPRPRKEETVFHMCDSSISHREEWGRVNPREKHRCLKWPHWSSAATAAKVQTMFQIFFLRNDAIRQPRPDSILDIGCFSLNRFFCLFACFHFKGFVGQVCQNCAKDWIQTFSVKVAESPHRRC